MRGLKKNSGFSLIELMVVVAIIGILASVAIPSFQKFQRKAKQSEAKAMLGALYTAEKAFSTEYNSYYSGIDTIGFAPTGQLVYNVGFTKSKPNVPNKTTFEGAITVTQGLVANSDEFCGATGSECDQIGTALAITAPDPTRITFTAVATGDLDGGDGTSGTDTWTITNAKIFTNTAVGL